MGTVPKKVKKITVYVKSSCFMNHMAIIHVTRRVGWGGVGATSIFFKGAGVPLSRTLLTLPCHIIKARPQKHGLFIYIFLFLF